MKLEALETHAPSGVEVKPRTGASAASARRRRSVLIDGFNLSLEKGTGVATYARNLSFSLRDLGCDVRALYGGAFSASDPPLIQEISFFDPPPEGGGKLAQTLRRLRGAFAPTRNRAFRVPMTGAVVSDAFASRLPYFDSIWNASHLFDKAHTQFHLLGMPNRVSMPEKPDLCHWTYPLPIRMDGVPNIYTLHDLVPLRLPYTTLDRKARYLRLMRWICRTASHIVTVSEHSKRDIVNLLGVPPEKVTNTYQAVSIPDAYRQKPEEVVRRELENTFGLQFRNYFLFFGSIEPKKNIGRLLEGYLGSGAASPLVVVGAQAWKSGEELRMLQADEIRARLTANGDEPTSKIVRLEYVPFSLLVNLIRGARAVVFPSLYEGFGLPILEAMLLGTPVLTSNTSSIPEIAGDAALMVNPYDSREIAEGIRALETRDDLCEELRARGVLRASLFSEAAYRDRLSAVYDSVLAERPPQ